MSIAVSEPAIARRPSLATRVLGTYLRDVLGRIADHPIKRIGDLLPWNWQPTQLTAEAA